MSNQRQSKPQKDGTSGSGGGSPRFNPYWIYGILGIILLVVFIGPSLMGGGMEKKDLNFFKEQSLNANDVEKVVILNDKRAEVYLKEDVLTNEKYDFVPETRFNMPNEGPHYFFTVSSGDRFSEQLAQWEEERDTRIEVSYEDSGSWVDILSWILPFGLIILLWLFIMRRVSGGMGGAGGQIFNIGKSKATLFDNENTKVKVTFNDVAGLDEAKEEVMEIVSFLKDPQKYTRLGGKIPKGALLVGPPGTGKTLLAKAMAGEAQVPFFTISGSDFVEMFVGVGASRVRDLFKQAREKAPCIIFIDEIDAIGRTRGRNVMQGNDERENTLNQLLVEMDGFSSEKGVIMIAATNRPDVLDKALLRPGRFDRQIVIDQPDLKGREAIFEVHLKGIRTSDEIDAHKLAAQTPGFVGADIANICNEAALIAARKSKESVEMDDFNDAIDRVIGGLEKKNKIISPEEKKIIAYHEAGHAVSSWFLEYANPLVKVSIVPRGQSLGAAWYLPEERNITTTEQMLDEMAAVLGGRAAEDIIFGRISTGAQNDLDKVTKYAYSMAVIYGMTDKIGHISYYDMLNQNSFHKPYSDDTAREIDQEIKSIIDGQYKRVKDLLREHLQDLHSVAGVLLEKEVIFKDDVRELIGERPYGHNGDDDGEAAGRPAESDTPAPASEEDLAGDD